MADTEEIITRIGVSGQDDVIAAFGSIARAAEEAGERMAASFGGIAEVFTGVGVAIAGAAAGFGVWVHHASEAVDGLAKFAAQTGESVESVSALESALVDLGGSADNIGGAFRRLALVAERTWDEIKRQSRDARDQQVNDALGVQEAQLNLYKALQTYQASRQGLPAPAEDEQTKQAQAQLNYQKAVQAAHEAQKKADLDRLNNLDNIQKAVQSVVQGEKTLAEAGKDANLELGNIFKGLVIGAAPGAPEAIQHLTGNLNELVGIAPNVKQLFYDIADLMKNSGDATTATAIAIHAFGRTVGTDLIATMREGSEAIKAQEADARKYGLFISTDMARQAEDFHRAYNALTGDLSTTIQQIGVTFAPTFTQGLKDLDQFLKENHDSLMKWVGDLKTSVVPIIQEFFNAIKGLMASLAGVKLKPEDTGAAEWKATFDGIGESLRTAKGEVESLAGAFKTLWDLLPGGPVVKTAELVGGLVAVRAAIAGVGAGIGTALVSGGGAAAGAGIGATEAGAVGGGALIGGGLLGSLAIPILAAAIGGALLLWLSSKKEPAKEGATAPTTSATDMAAEKHDAAAEKQNAAADKNLSAAAKLADSVQHLSVLAPAKFGEEKKTVPSAAGGTAEVSIRRPETIGMPVAGPVHERETREQVAKRLGVRPQDIDWSLEESEVSETVPSSRGWHPGGGLGGPSKTVTAPAAPPPLSLPGFGGLPSMEFGGPPATADIKQGASDIKTGAADFKSGVASFLSHLAPASVKNAASAIGSLFPSLEETTAKQSQFGTTPGIPSAGFEPVQAIETSIVDALRNAFTSSSGTDTGQTADKNSQAADKNVEASDKLESFADRFNDIISQLNQLPSTLGTQMTPSGSSGGGEGLAHGGVIQGPGGVDNVPAMLTAGEGVITTKAMGHYGGESFVNAVNSLSLPHFALGGLVHALETSLVPRFASGGQVPAASSIASGRPINLHIGGETITGLTATAGAAESISRIAVERAVRSGYSGGGKSSWYRGS